jgi:hypothetical protein
MEKTAQTLEARSVQREKARAAQIKQTHAAVRALRAPLEQMVSENAAASRALLGLRKHRFGGIDKLQPEVPVRDSSSSIQSLHMQLHENLSIVTPPYDFEWHWGNLSKFVHDRNSGSIGVEGRSGAMVNGAGDDVAAASGIGLVITTDKPARLSVRPYIDHTWQVSVGAAGLGAIGRARVGVDATVFVDGKFLDQPGLRRDEAFFDSRGTQGEDLSSGGATAWVPALTLDFELERGQVAVVNYGAYVECSHDGGLFGAAAGGGWLNGRVRWIVVERFLR